MFVLAHLTDPHLGPLPRIRVRDLLSKRFLGYANWRRSRSRVHRRPVLEAVIAHMNTHQPDHIAVTGDLVNIALPAEFITARDWLADLGGPGRVSVVPGNHDAYVPIPDRRGLRNWADYMTSDPDSAPAPLKPGSDIAFPYIRRHGPISLIGVSTAVPSPFFRATGHLGDAQMKRLDAMLLTEGQQRRYRVLMIHHPPHPKGTRKHKRLTDAAELMAVLRRRGVELVLYGHNHRYDLSWHEGPNDVFPAVGAPSASAAYTGTGHEGGYHLFEFSAAEEGIEARLSRFAADHSGAIQRIGPPVRLGGSDQETVSALLKATSPH